jgi:uncharacterized protein YkwD
MRHFFLPNSSAPHNRSHAVASHSLATYALTLILFIFTSTWVTYNPEVLGYATNVSVRELFFKTNELRIQNNLGTLKLNSKLNEAAKKKATDMFENDYWSHNSPSGKEPWDFVKSAGYDYIYAGENLAVDFAESQEVIDAWYASLSHRENLLNDKFTEVGFATINGTLKGRQTTLVVQMFGYPKLLNSNEIGFVGDVSEELSDEVILVSLEPNVSPSTNEAPIYSFFPVLTLSKAMSIVIGLFLVVIFALDGYYAKKNMMYRVTGHTFLHIFLLVLAIFGIWITNVGMIM